MNDLFILLLFLIAYVGAGTLTAGIALRLGETESDSWALWRVWPICLFHTICRYPFRFGDIVCFIGTTPPHPKEIPMSNPEVEFSTRRPL